MKLHPYRVGLKAEIGSRISHNPTFAGSDRTVQLRELLGDIQKRLQHASDNAPVRLWFDLSKPALLAQEDQEDIIVPLLSHARWEPEGFAAVESSSLWKRATAGLQEQELRQDLMLAHCILRILSAPVAIQAAEGDPLPDDVRAQAERMLDAMELQLSLVIDKLERKADQGSDNLDPVIDCLDTIMRGDGQERFDALQQYHDNKYFNHINSGSLIRVLDSVYELITGKPNEQALRD